MIETELRAREYVSGLCDASAIVRLDRYATMLEEEAGLQNLVSKSSLEHMWVRHIADSAQLLEYVPRETQLPWLDLGTGAGLPGIVTALIWPEQKMRLVLAPVSGHC